MRCMLIETVGLLLIVQLAAAQIAPLDNDSDLELFVTRPDIRPPKLLVETFDDAATHPGYWLVAPYADLVNRRPTNLFQSHQIGPHIYDNKGQLIWSGATLFPGRSVFDFKLSEGLHGEPRLSFLLTPNEYDTSHLGGAGVILGSDYEPASFIQATRGSRMVNMHEMTLTDGGASALLFIYEPRFFESLSYSAWVLDLGFVEVDVRTHETRFEWWAMDHVSPLQSTVQRPAGHGGPDNAWDYFHINSVDKDNDGNFLVSGRHCNAIYKVSGRDGSILWQLGGVNSTIDADFGFSSQHDARFRNSATTDGNHQTTTITFLNNASDGLRRTANVSSALVVAVDEQTRRARMVHKYDRPDGFLTTLRGNVQTLPNSNILAAWSGNGYATEYSADGRLVQSVRFASNRFATYRQYKTTLNFVATPKQRPDLVCRSYGVSSSSAHTACYVSWNGATEVAEWRFFAIEPLLKARLINLVARTGFETEFIYEGCYREMFVQAVDRFGQGLRNSSIVTTTTPLQYTCPYYTSGSDTREPASLAADLEGSTTSSDRLCSDQLEGKKGSAELPQTPPSSLLPLPTAQQVAQPRLTTAFYCVVAGLAGMLASSLTHAYLRRRGDKRNRYIKLETSDI